MAHVPSVTRGAQPLRRAGPDKRAGASKCLARGAWAKPQPREPSNVRQALLKGSPWAEGRDPLLILKYGKLVLRRIDERSRISGHAFEARCLLERAVANYTSRPHPPPSEVGVRAARAYRQAARVVAAACTDAWGADQAARLRNGIHTYTVELLCASGFLVIALEALREARLQFRQSIFAKRPHIQLCVAQAEFDQAVELMDRSWELDKVRKLWEEAKLLETRKRRLTARRNSRGSTALPNSTSRPGSSIPLSFASTLVARSQSSIVQQSSETRTPSVLSSPGRRLSPSSYSTSADAMVVEMTAAAGGAKLPQSPKALSGGIRPVAIEGIQTVNAPAERHELARLSSAEGGVGIVLRDPGGALSQW